MIKLQQAVLDCAPHSSIRRATGEAEEVLFVLAGAGELRLDGERHALEPEAGANLGPGQEYELAGTGAEPLRIVSVRIPSLGLDGAHGGRGDGPLGVHASLNGPAAPHPTDAERSEAHKERVVVRRLADQEAQAATTDRSFRIVADPSTGLRSATHFVGYIPTSRAPDHFHTYDEVIYVIEGEGSLHVGGESEAIVAGSRIELPARTVHCLENTGEGVMRLVAVFRPAGSPAAAYYPDGTPAYPGTPPLVTA